MRVIPQSVDLDMQSLQSIDFVDIAEEDLRAIAMRVFYFFTKVYPRRLALWRIFKPVPYTEFGLFGHARPEVMDKILHAPYADLMNKPIYIPTHMLITYPTAMDHINKGFRFIQPATIFKTINDELQRLRTSLERGNYDFSKESLEPLSILPQLLPIMSVLMSHIGNMSPKQISTMYDLPFDKIQAMLKKIKIVKNHMTISPEGMKQSHDKDTPLSNIPTAPFGAHFKSQRDFSKFIQEMISLEAILLMVVQVSKSIETITQHSAAIAKTVSDNMDKINNNEVAKLGEYLRSIAVTIDMYGYLIGLEMQIEHNVALSFMLIYNILNKK